jgi:L-asparaginase/Glu-tRNA(Gln) amidotransferase subunit D
LFAARGGFVINQEKKLPLVKVIATGGTIANTPSGRLHAGEVAQVIPELKNLARIEIEEFFESGAQTLLRTDGSSSQSE